MTDTRAAFAAILRYLSPRGLTHADIAAAVGADVGTVSRWMRGAARPEAGNLTDLLLALGADDEARTVATWLWRRA